METLAAHLLCGAGHYCLSSAPLGIQQSQKSEQPCFGTIIPHDSSDTVVDFEVVQFRVSRSALGVLPAKHRHQRFPPDEVVKSVISMEELSQYYKKRSLHAGATGLPSLTSLLTIAPRFSLRRRFWKTSPSGLLNVLISLRDEELYFLDVESDDFFAFVVTQFVDAGGRGTL